MVFWSSVSVFIDDRKSDLLTIYRTIKENRQDYLPVPGRIIIVFSQNTELVDLLLLNIYRGMHIPVQSCFDGCVSQHFTENFGIDAQFNTSRGISVPAGMEGIVRNIQFIDQFFEFSEALPWLHVIGCSGDHIN